jgi:ornithine carbamoyltransferase
MRFQRTICDTAAETKWMDLLRLNDLTSPNLHKLIDRAVEMEREFRAGTLRPTLAGKRIALIVDDGGWRNTTALDLGMRLLGATCVHVPATLDGKEAIEDLAKYLDNWFDLSAIRAPSLATMAELAKRADCPIVNLRTRENHPCETLGDLSFVKSRCRNLDNLVVAAVAPAANIIHSWAEASEAVPLSLIQIYPRDYWLSKASYPRSSIEQTEDMDALRRADVIVTDCWPNGGSKEALLPFQITTRLLDQAKPECAFIPCPPVTRGEEVSVDAMNHRSCVSFDAKAFLMHAQNAFVEAALS